MASHEGWYIAEPDGETFGPMTRAELIEQFQRGLFSADALAWHLDLSEWHPLARIASATGGSGTPAAGVAAAPVRGRLEAASSILDFDEEPPTLSAAQEKPTKTVASVDKAPPPPAARQQKKSSTQKSPGKKSRPRTLNSPSNDDGRRLLSHPQSSSASAAAAAAAAASAPKTVDKAEAEKNAQLALQAGRRFVARALDTATFGMIGAALLWGVLQRLVEPDSGFATQTPTLWPLLMLAIFALVPLEILAMSMAGTTPGKALLGLRVTRRDGTRPSPVDAARRTVNVLWRALGLGIPFLTPITLIVAGVKLINNGSTSWDADLGLRSVTTELSGGRVKAIFIASIALWIFLSSSEFSKLAETIAAVSAQWLVR